MISLGWRGGGQIQPWLLNLHSCLFRYKFRYNLLFLFFQIPLLLILLCLHMNNAKAPGQGTSSSYETLSQYRSAGYKFHFLNSKKSFDTFFRFGWRPENPSCLLNMSPTLHLSHCLSYEKGLSYLSPLREQCKKLYNPVFEPQGEVIEITNLCLLLISMIFNIYLCLKQYCTRPTTTDTHSDIRKHQNHTRSRSQKHR